MNDEQVFKADPFETQGSRLLYWLPSSSPSSSPRPCHGRDPRALTGGQPNAHKSRFRFMFLGALSFRATTPLTYKLVANRMFSGKMLCYQKLRNLWLLCRYNSSPGTKTIIAKQRPIKVTLCKNGVGLKFQGLGGKPLCCLWKVWGRPLFDPSIEHKHPSSFTVLRCYIFFPNANSSPGCLIQSRLCQKCQPCLFLSPFISLTRMKASWHLVKTEILRTSGWNRKLIPKWQGNENRNCSGLKFAGKLKWFINSIQGPG